MRVLITGINGFVGGHLMEYLISKKGVEIHGLGRSVSKRETTPTRARGITVHLCDICDPKAVSKVFRQVKPDRIFHLAAQSFVPFSWVSPKETLNVNIMGQLNILEVLRQGKDHPMIHVAGSSEAYGRVFPGEIPIRETNGLRPLSPYGVSKAAQDLLAYQYHQSFRLPIVLTRAFSHTGPGQSDRFVASNFAKQVALIEAGRCKPMIYVGNLESIRDFTDVRDIVKAYWLALEKCKKGEVYNICSGVGRKIGDILDFYLKHGKVEIKVKRDKTRMRPLDVPILIGDAAKFKKQTHWEPVIPFEKTLADLLDYWRHHIAK